MVSSIPFSMSLLTFMISGTIFIGSNHVAEAFGVLQPPLSCTVAIRHKNHNSLRKGTCQLAAAEHQEGQQDQHNEENEINGKNEEKIRSLSSSSFKNGPPSPELFQQLAKDFLQSRRNSYDDADDADDANDDDTIFESSSSSSPASEEFISSSPNETVESDFPSALPERGENPFRSRIDKLRQDVSNVYSDDELMGIWNTHNEISDELFEEEGDDDSPSSPSLQDLILKTIKQDDDDNDEKEKKKKKEDENTTKEVLLLHDDDLKKKIPKIRAIASDVDGTILSSSQTVHPKTLNAIQRAVEMTTSSQKKKIDYYFPATGKSRKGAMDSLGPEISSLLSNSPGVYLQGLYCVDSVGEVIFEEKLNKKVIQATEEEIINAYEYVSVVAYDGDDLYTTEQSDIVIHLHEHYGEPLPRLLEKDTSNDDENNNDDGGSAAARPLATHGPSMHKLLIMSNDIPQLTNIIRPKLERIALTHGASVTQALPTMLELLPPGCSKALGVEKVCEALGVNAQEELLALGDAENDAGMLDMACIGVAMGNATPAAKDVADYVMGESNDDGGAGIAMNMFGFGEEM